MNNLPAATILREMDEIQAVMRTDREAYNRSPDMQARYRSLAAQKAGSSGTVLDSSDTAPLLPIASRSEYSAAVGTLEGYDQYLKRIRMASDWVFALPANERRSFVAKFEALPDDVAFAALEEMGRPAPHLPPSSARAVEEFRKLPEGALLAHEWGDLCGVNLAQVRARLFRAIDHMEERSIPSFVDWLEGLSTECAVAIYRRLAA